MEGQANKQRGAGSVELHCRPGAGAGALFRVDGYAHLPQACTVKGAPFPVQKKPRRSEA